MVISRFEHSTATIYISFSSHHELYNIPTRMMIIHHITYATASPAEARTDHETQAVTGHHPEHEQDDERPGPDRGGQTSDHESHASRPDERADTRFGPGW